MTTPLTPVDVRVALGIDGKWMDISDDIAFEDGIALERGSSNDTPRLETSRGRMTILPSNGRYMRLNPLSDLYGKLNMDQPARIDRYLLSQNFSVNASNGWSATDLSPAWQSLPWTLYGEGGTVQNSDWSVSSGTGRMSIPVAAAHRIAYLNGAQYRNGEVICSVQFPTANITGGGVGASILLRGQAGNSYAECNMFIDTDESISVVTSFTDNSPPAGGEITTNIVHTGQKLWMAAGADGYSLYMKIWEGLETDEPIDWMFVGDGSFFGSGFIGLKAIRYSGNNNSSPMVVQFDDFRFRHPRQVGTVPNWSPRWDKTGKFENTPIEVSGVVRRLDNNEQTVNSPLSNALPSTTGLQAYWPCEDEKGAQSFASAMAYNAGPMTWTADAGQSGPSVGGFSGFIATKPIPTVGKARWRGVVPPYTPTTNIAQVRFLQHIPSGGMDNLAIICQFYVTGTALRWEYKYLTGGSCQLDCYDRNDVNILAAGPFAFNMNDHLCRVSIQLKQNGANIDWLLAAPEEGHNSYGYNSGTLNGYTVGQVHDLRFAVGNPTVNYGDLAIGQITVAGADNNVLDMWQPFGAFDGELDYERGQRICDENGVDFRLVGKPADLLMSTPMGPQPIDTVVNILNDVADTGQNVIYETRTIHNGITLRLNKTLRNQDKQLTLDLAGHYLEEKIEPDDDPDRRFNDITAKRKDGSSYRAEETNGPFGIDQIGRRPRDYSCNPQFDAMLQDIANFQLVRNTINEYLYRSVTSSLDNSAVRADSNTARKMLDLDLYDRMIIKGGENRKLFNEIEQLPRGYTETLDQFRHRFTWNTTSGSPYLTLATGDAEYDALTSEVTGLWTSLDNTATSFQITRPTGEPMWSAADPPDKIMVGGERMVLNSITNPTTPSFVSVGTAAHADNANVVPGLPGGGSTTGDILVLAVWIRNNLINVSVSGYTAAGDAANIKLFTKIRGSSESAPTVTVSGGSAGDTISAQICAIRNVDIIPIYSAAQGNGSTQNIAVPGTYQAQAAWLAIQFGWKQDDWTSVTPPQYMTEIGEPSSTLGNDQGGTWAYKIGTDHVDVGAGTFVVTGGASATTVSAIVVWGFRQIMNVTRSDNGVVKSHAANTPITAWRETYIGLGRS